MVSLIDDALYLRSLYELSEMTTPIQSPSSWASSAWGSGVRPEVGHSHIHLVCSLTRALRHNSITGSAKIPITRLL